MTSYSPGPTLLPDKLELLLPYNLDKWFFTSKLVFCLLNNYTWVNIDQGQHWFLNYFRLSSHPKNNWVFSTLITFYIFDNILFRLVLSRPRYFGNLFSSLQLSKATLVLRVPVLGISLSNNFWTILGTELLKNTTYTIQVLDYDLFFNLTKSMCYFSKTWGQKMQKPW